MHKEVRIEEFHVAYLSQKEPVTAVVGLDHTRAAVEGAVVVVGDVVVGVAEAAGRQELEGREQLGVGRLLGALDDLKNGYKYSFYL